MNYKYDDFLQIVKRSAVVEFIMTKNVAFYESTKNALEFCNERDISVLPSHDNLHVYELKDNEFVKRVIQSTEKLKVTDFIFDRQVMESFEHSFVKYVYDNEKIVGILHFCDYNRKAVYIYVYGLINELEELIRDDLTNNGYTDKDLLEYYKDKDEIYKNMHKRYEESKGKLGPFQFADLKPLIRFHNHSLRTKINDSISELRNDIVHSKQLVKTKDRAEHLEHFDYGSFKEFRDKVYALCKTIEKVKERVK